MNKTASTTMVIAFLAFTSVQAAPATPLSTCAQLSNTTWTGTVAIGVKTKTLTLAVNNNVVNSGSISGTVQIDDYHPVLITESQCTDGFNSATFVITTGDTANIFNPLNSSLGGTLGYDEQKMAMQGVINLDLSPGKMITSKSVLGELTKK